MPTAYDRVAYPSMAHPQTFAEALAIKGWLRGVDVAPPATARVLELGVGDGFNLAAMAIAHPGGHYTGLDYAAEAVARGREICADLGLHQIHLLAADIRQLPPDLGEFDYIIAHGVYSWVPVEVREALLAAIGRLLAPDGVAFVSYLALPGAYFREAVRTMMRFHTQEETDPASRCAQARSMLHLIAHAREEPTFYSHWLAREEELVLSHSDNSLFHDELSEISAPLLFTEFVAAADRHGLRFLSEAEYLTPIGVQLKPEVREQLRPLEHNRLLLEQYLDFIEGRRFRQTLLCRPGRGDQIVLPRLDALHVRFPAAPEGELPPVAGDAPARYIGQKKARVHGRTPLEKAVLAETSAHSEFTPVPQVVARTRARLVAAGVTPPADFEEAIRHFLIRCYVPGLVELSWQEQPWAAQVPERPLAHPLGRWFLAQGSPSALTYGGQLVAIDSELGRLLVSLLDGTRDFAALLTAIRSWLTARHAAGEPSAKLPAPDDPALAEQLERSLTGLCRLKLFASPPR